MRVVLIGCHAFDYGVEFAETAALSCDVLFLTDGKPLAARQGRSAGLTAIGLPWPRHRHLANLVLVYRMWRQIRRWAPDLVHFLGENNVWLNLLPLLLRRRHIVTTIHDIEYHPGDHSSNQVPRVFARWFIKQSDALIVHGEKLRRDAERKLGIRPDRLFVVPHLPLFHYRTLAQSLGLAHRPDGRFRILFFGRIFAYKGVDHLMEASEAVRVAVPNAQFIVAGSGDADLVARLRAMPADLFDVRARFVPDDEVAALFTMADLVVLPYIEASQSGVLMIAMTFGVPVVATDVGEIGEAVRSHGVGLVVPPADPASLAEAITTLVTEPGRYQACRANAEAAMGGGMSQPAFAARIAKVYAEIKDRLEPRPS